MTISQNVSLKNYNTFGVDYKADCIIHFSKEKEAQSFFKESLPGKRPLLILGGGSNILFTSDFHGTIIRYEFSGIKIESKSCDDVIISAGAGVEWDKLVEWTVNKGLSGMENLSLVPGNAGASPVQNIGAYGVEVKDIIEKVRAISTADGSIRWFNKDECEFGYRTSIFKGKEKGKYLVTKVYFKLKVDQQFNLEYGTLKDEVQKLGGATLLNVRNAVINIRRKKLPDPEIIGNAGSFFKNPVVASQFANDLKKDHPMLPIYEGQSGFVKLAAGWLIDQCGWRGVRMNDAGVHDKQALVLVNHGHATGKEIYDLSEEIKVSVQKKFGLELEREVEVIGSI